MAKKTVRDINVADKRVLVRVDFNVPLDRETNAITDDSRIREALPTITYLIGQKAKVILCSHLGRPKGPNPKESLAPTAKRLSELLGRPVQMAKDCIGPEAEAMAKALPAGGVLILENVRFHPQEEKNDPAFAKALASLAEAYVDDAFGSAHRAHASTEGVTKHLPSVAGFLMEKEMRFLLNAVTNPERPMAAVVGGAKVSDKLAMLEHMADRVDAMMIGGGMCATFFKARGYEIGTSLLEAEMMAKASAVEAKAKRRGIPLHLPVDVVIGDRFAADANSRTVAANAVPPGWMILDIGPKTVELFGNELNRQKTVVWNGPMGVFEMPKFAAGTEGVAKAIASLKATTIVGGGSTAEAIHKLRLEGKITHVSTGGGASLEILEGKTLPGVAALMDK
ncbi:MAG: phosphoglycerate kinase [Chloroflexi bacterium]|nr:phosphoglycerate kinase [Chloroflexota bacterium]